MILDETIFEMLRKGEEFCHHPPKDVMVHHTPGTPKREHIVMCCRCMKSKEVYADDFWSAAKAFQEIEQRKFDGYEFLKGWWKVCLDLGWKPEYIPKLFKGDDMSEADYKRGVIDATEPFPGTAVSMMYPVSGVNAALMDRRKKLLTKKVTKWANVYKSPSLSDPACQYFGTATLYNSEYEARQNGKMNYLGTYPIEIEVEI